MKAVWIYTAEKYVNDFEYVCTGKHLLSYLAKELFLKKVRPLIMLTANENPFCATIFDKIL